MNRLMSILFSCFVILIFQGCGQSVSEKPKTENPTTEVEPEVAFQAFWTIFRQAALDENYSELKKHCMFPLPTRGEMDNDPIISYSETEFQTLFSAFLQSPTGLNLDNFNETQKDYLKQNEQITFNENKLPMLTVDSEKENQATAHISSMVFTKEPQGWKLSMLYLDEETYTKSGKNKES